MSIVNAKNFTFTYPGSDESVINQVSFEIEDGEVLGIVGPLGAGKTTLCRAIAGLVPSITGGEVAGAIEVSNGNHQTKSNSNDGQVGMVFEDYAAQLIQLKVLEEVKTPLLNRGLSHKEAEDRARELLKKVGLSGQDLEKKRIWDLSGGQQQRLAIAATLAMEPSIVILDNVMDKLDPKGREQVRDIVTELNGHKTQVIVDRDADLLLQKTQRLLILVDGQAIAQGKPEEMFKNAELLDRADIEPPLSLRVARALGMSESPLTLQEFQQAYLASRMQDPASLTVGKHFSAELPAAKQNFGDPLVCMQDVTFCYSDDKPKVLADFNLTIRAGEVHAIVGRNGAGKTTVIKHLAGLVKPNQGKVTVCGTDTQQESVPSLGLTVGTVLQNPDDQISERTVRDEIGFPLKQRQYDRQGWFSKQKHYDDNYIQERVLQVCELAGITDLLDEDPFLLPRGQRKLVTIAAALVVDPKVLLLDEPTIGLGAKARRQIQQAIANLRDRGKAVLLVSNNDDFVAEIADTVTILEQGRIALQGSVRQVFAEENWARLAELHIQPSQVAQLARRLNLKALTCAELVSQLSSK
jgi:energy-coupling factor transport system ATP-binding protein